MTKEEFIKQYCTNSKLSEKDRKYLLETNEAVPCDCGEHGCEGWHMKSKFLISLEKGELQES